MYIVYRFPELTKFLRDTRVIRTMKSLVSRLHYSAFFFHGNGDVSPYPVQDNINVRMFGAIYMITEFPNEVFDGRNPTLIQNLRDSSGRMLGCFTCCGRVHVRP